MESKKLAAGIYTLDPILRNILEFAIKEYGYSGHELLALMSEVMNSVKTELQPEYEPDEEEYLICQSEHFEIRLLREISEQLDHNPSFYPGDEDMKGRICDAIRSIEPMEDTL